MERPILMHARSVRGILDGFKTQTRRVMRLRVRVRGQLPRDHYRACPYGQADDTLWVRETWGAPEADLPGVPKGRRPQPGDRIVFRANPADDYQWSRAPGFCWRPSIHMPRWACRITLRLDDVRVQRIQDISDLDCEAEGVRPSVDGDASDWRDEETGWRRTFRQRWDELNAKRGYGWDTNPWVWALTFTRLTP